MSKIAATLAPRPSFRFDRVEVQVADRRLLIDGAPAALGARAFDLLVVLATHADQLVSKNELLTLVWPGLVVEENNLQVQISALRRLLGPHAIATIPGRGYRFTAVLDGAAPEPRDDSKPPAATGIASAPLTNLPTGIPTLYGRADDLLALRALVDAHNLVTVVGAGGIGKTALAQALGHELRESFADGVWLVELAPLAAMSLVAPTVAGVLRLNLDGEVRVQALAQLLSSRRMLIVLDNCEHLLPAVAELAAALHRAAPGVRLLATSQETLKVAQEQVYRLGPLALPADAQVDSARHSGAVALFEARARAANPQFALTEHNIAAVIDICRHLDGIALAIELAAARVPLLGVEGLRARLDERFRVLTGGARLALRRHQTLRAALDWSHGLLTPDEQKIFRRLGIFAGSFGMDSAQRVAADHHLDRWAVLDHLGALVDKSLVVAEAGDEPRYRLLETTRSFAMEELQRATETEMAMQSHAAAMQAVFEASLDSEYRGSAQVRLDRCLPDLDNARAALDWAAGANGDVQLQIALTGAMAWIWVGAGQRPEGLRRTQSAMAKITTGTPPHLEARLMASWSRMAFPESGARELAADARAVSLNRVLGERAALFATLCQYAATQAHCYQLDETAASLQEAARIIDPNWPPALRARLLMSRRLLLDRESRFEEGMAIGEELLQLAIDLDDSRLTLGALITLERTAAALGRWDESVTRGRDLVSRMQRDRSLRSGIENIVLVNLCMALTQSGQIDEALEVARRALPLVEQAGRVLDLLDPYALLAFRRGSVADAARMLGRADMRYAAENYQREVVEQQLRNDLLVRLRETMAPAELATLMREGEALSDDEAVRLALRE